MFAAVLGVSAQVRKPYLVGSDGKYLGTFGDQYSRDSINNPYGRYGSEYSRESVNNPYGRYGSEYSRYSATNPYTRTPPRVIYPQTQRWSYYTANPYLR